MLFRKDKNKEKQLNTLDAQVEQLEKHTAIFEAQLKFREKSTKLIEKFVNFFIANKTKAEENDTTRYRPLEI